MARPKKDEAPDLSVTHELSEGLIARLACPPGVPKVFLRDKDVTGLRVRVTANGVKSFVYEAKLDGKAISRTLGRFPLISIEEAKKEARALATTVKNNKQDPRVLERLQAEAAAAKAAAESAAKEAKAAEEKARTLTVGEIWPIYMQHGRPKRRDTWKPRYVADLNLMVLAGGEKKKRGAGLTRPGPLFPLMAMPLASINEDTLKVWFDDEALKGRHQAARALMMFRGFLRWCAGRPEYRALTDRDAGKASAILESLPTNTHRTDALEAAQVPVWWEGVAQLPNPAASAYLRCLLLTGARREEMAGLQWDHVDFRWKKLTIADKVSDTRTIPLTPYVAWLLASLPRAKGADDKPSPFVFASASKSGRITDPRSSHEKALKASGIEGLTLHGLRRSFSLLGESAGAPAGAIAQVMGHRPSATAEGYRPRSIDALRPYLAQIEAHILVAAGVNFDAKSEPGQLRAVA